MPLVASITDLWGFQKAALTDYTDASVTVPYNDSRTAKLTLSMHDPAVTEVKPLERMLRIWHVWSRGRTCVFWGPILAPDWNFEQEIVEISAHDISIRLKHHYLNFSDAIVGPVGNGFEPVDGGGLQDLFYAGTNTFAQTAAGIPDLGVNISFFNNHRGAAPRAKVISTFIAGDPAIAVDSTGGFPNEGYFRDQITFTRFHYVKKVEFAGSGALLEVDGGAVGQVLPVGTEIVSEFEFKHAADRGDEVWQTIQDMCNMVLGPDFDLRPREVVEKVVLPTPPPSPLPPPPPGSFQADFTGLGVVLEEPSGFVSFPYHASSTTCAASAPSCIDIPLVVTTVDTITNLDFSMFVKTADYHVGTGPSVSFDDPAYSPGQSWTGNFQAQLVHPDGTTAWLLMHDWDDADGDGWRAFWQYNWGCFIGDSETARMTFADDAAVSFNNDFEQNDYPYTTPTLAGTFRPFDALSAFDGKPSDGTWTLRVWSSFNDGTRFRVDAAGFGFNGAAAPGQVLGHPLVADGPDFIEEPDERERFFVPVEGTTPNYCNLYVYDKRDAVPGGSRDRRDTAQFHYGCLLDNLEDFGLNPSGDQVRNHYVAVTSNTGPDGGALPRHRQIATNLSSRKKYGTYVGWEAVGKKATAADNISNLELIAESHVATYSEPPRYLTVRPRPEDQIGDVGNAVIFQRDFLVGELVAVVARKGAMDVEMDAIVTEVTLTQDNALGTTRTDVKLVPYLTIGNDTADEGDTG